jgi:3-deoxy-D-manno-octulosonic-acid transferase
MVYLLYDMILLASALVLVPYFMVRGLGQGKRRRGIRERLGIYGTDRLGQLQGRQVIWVHAVSVGETRAAIPLLREIKKVHPDCALVVSNVTETGHAVAGHIPEVDLCLFFPFDLSWVVRSVLRQVRPALIVIVETEIWPNFLRLARRAKVPVMLVNGRISDRSFPRYRLGRFLVRPILKHFSALCMQSELDAQRIRLLGAPPERVEVTRNLKFDMKMPPPDQGTLARLKEGFNLPEDTLVWAAGSTHAGEEQAIVSLYRRLVGEGRKIVLALVPRHPERCRAVGEMLTAQETPFVLRSALDEKQDPLKPGEVLLVDSVGEMLNFYAVADLVFVGGSLAPVGGHNILEASLLKKPVVFGPYMHNFKEISRMVLEVGGGIQAVGEEDLAAAIYRLLDDSELRRTMGESGYALLQQNAGATARTLAVIEKVLGH